MIENGDNPLDDGSDGGSDTMDKVFLLSLKEAELFPDAALRRARNTAWAEAQGAWNDGGFGVWLLRSPGIFERFAAHVFSHGSLDYEGDDVDRGGYAVRPAVYVDLANGNGMAGAAGNLWEARETPVTPLLLAEGWADSAKPGDVLLFGHCEQDNNGANGQEPIRWIILSMEGGRALLVSERNLDSRPYHTAEESVTWEGCALRKWLNGDFLNAAFTAGERDAILRTQVANEDNPVYGTPGGSGTTDKVFLLSLDEAEGLLNDAFRKARNTAWAEAQGTDDKGGFGFWWLRSPGDGPSCAALVSCEGFVDNEGDVVDLYGYAVRPALYIGLSYGNGKAGDAGDWQETEEVSQTTLLPEEGWASAAKPGDILIFGHYEQDNDRANGKEPIRWIILSMEGDRALLVSEENLDCKLYHTKREAVTWEECSLRQWLNSEFLFAAFTEGEQDAILQTLAANADNPEYGTDGGKSTVDKAFLLSVQGAELLFQTNDVRRARNTAYTRAQGAVEGDGCGWWWLRTPGEVANNAAGVNPFGGISTNGLIAVSGNGAVRPALYIDLSYGNGKAGVAKDWRAAGEASEKPFLLREGVERTAGPGDILIFGYYEQDNNKANGKEPIRWIIHSIGGINALLVSEQNLDCKPYHTKREAITWEKCALRQWLNGEFLSAAFTVGERDAILRTHLANRDNPVYGTDGGNSTTDKVFLMSLQGAETFPNDELRRARNTDYTRARGAADGDGCGWWWLRTPGEAANYVTGVNPYGGISANGLIAVTVNGAVRPALCVALSPCVF